MSSTLRSLATRFLPTSKPSKSSPRHQALLDLFLWLSYRCFVAKGPEVIPLFGSYGLTQQLGCVEYSRPSRFRAMLDQWLKTIRHLWPECPATICANGKALRIGRQHAMYPMAHSLIYGT